MLLFSPLLPLKMPELIDQGRKVTAELDSSTPGACTHTQTSSAGAQECSTCWNDEGTAAFYSLPSSEQGRDYTTEASCSSDFDPVHTLTVKAEVVGRREG